MSKLPTIISPREPMVDKQGLPTRSWWRVIDSLIGLSGQTATPLTVTPNAILNAGTLTSGGAISSPELAPATLIGNAGSVLAQPAVVAVGAGLSAHGGTLAAASLAAGTLSGNPGVAAAAPTSVAIGNNLLLNSGTLSALSDSSDQTLMYLQRDTTGQVATLASDLADVLALALLAPRTPDPADLDIGDATFVFTQGIAATVWVIVHPLNTFPSVVVVDSAGNMVEGDVLYNSTSQVTLTFAAGFAGSAYLI